MNLMEARKEKLKSKLLSLSYISDDPNTIIIPIPEGIKEENLVRNLQYSKISVECELDRLRNE